MLMAEVLQFWHISCRFDIENMAWALTWELLKLCPLSNIYAPKASTSAWGFTFSNFFSYIYSIHAYFYQFGENTNVLNHAYRSISLSILMRKDIPDFWKASQSHSLTKQTLQNPWKEKTIGRMFLKQRRL